MNDLLDDFEKDSFRKQFIKTIKGVIKVKQESYQKKIQKDVLPKLLKEQNALVRNLCAFETAKDTVVYLRETEDSTKKTPKFELRTFQVRALTPEETRLKDQHDRKMREHLLNIKNINLQQLAADLYSKEEGGWKEEVKRWQPGKTVDQILKKKTVAEFFKHYEKAFRIPEIAQKHKETEEELIDQDITQELFQWNVTKRMLKGGARRTSQIEPSEKRKRKSPKRLQDEPPVPKKTSKKKEYDEFWEANPLFNNNHKLLTNELTLLKELINEKDYAWKLWQIPIKEVLFPLYNLYMKLWKQEKKAQLMEQELEKGVIKIPKNLLRISTQCAKNPSFFDKQDSSTVWEHIKTENISFFQLLNLYNTLKNVKTNIRDLEDKIEKDPDNYVEDFVELLQDFDDKIKGQARQSIKDEVAGLVKSFVINGKILIKQHLNVTLLGPAGSGKTTLAVWIGKIFAKLGALVIGAFDLKSRSGLVGQYVGQTAPKVKSILNSNLESVLMIDEAYGLTCTSPYRDGPKFDPFGIEAINEIVNHLDKNKGQIMVIAVGYEKDMEACWFGANEGLRRRFPINFLLQDYTGEDLYTLLKDTFLKTVYETPDPMTAEGEKYLRNFLIDTFALWINQAGDMENLASAIVNKFYTNANKKIGSDQLQEIVIKMLIKKSKDELVKGLQTLKEQNPQEFAWAKTIENIDDEKIIKDLLEGFLANVGQTKKTAAKKSKSRSRRR